MSKEILTDMIDYVNGLTRAFFIAAQYFRGNTAR
jgi:hypothetical protein